MSVKFELEPWPFPQDHGWDKWMELWDQHGREVRGKPLALDHHRYREIWSEGRLVWVVARENDIPIGYSCHWWYKSLHFVERVGHDDLWFVAPGHRNLGIGRTVKEMGHEALRKAGAVMTEDVIRKNFKNERLMADIGFEVWGARWVKEFK